MTNIFDEILRSALALPPDSRAMLAEYLLESLKTHDQAAIDAAWAEVVEQRL